MNVSDINLTGKNALVTGASSGIGKSVALELARRGAFVFVNYNSNKDGALETLALIEKNGGNGEICQANVAQEEDVTQLFKDIRTKTEHLEILFNNAGGLVKRCKITEMNMELWDEVMNINLKSTFLCCRAALPLMSGKNWGRIINNASLAAHDGGGMGAVAYATSKGAIVSFTRGLAKEVANQGITVNCLAPGLINTAFQDVHSTAQSRQAMVNNTPLGREGQPNDVTGAVLFLVSDLASFITGETLNINGGMRMS